MQRLWRKLEELRHIPLDRYGTIRTTVNAIKDNESNSNLKNKENI